MINFKYKKDFKMIKKWNNFEYENIIYDLSHLNSHSMIYIDIKRNQKYNVYVTYSHHCFTKENKDLTKSENEDLIYNYKRDPRPFNFKRYEYSKEIRNILMNLEKDPRCFHDGHGKYLKIEINNEKYILSFSVFREKKKLKLHIHSAYPEEVGYPIKNIKSLKKIDFFIILYNTLKNKKIKY